MKLRKILSLILALSLMAGAPAMSALAETEIKVILNGEDLTFDVPPQMIGGRTLVPMRAIFEALGALVHYDEPTKTIFASAVGRKISMQIGNNVMLVDGKELVLDVPPQVVDNRTLVPIRAVSEGLDALVNWLDKTKTVVIETADFPGRLLAALKALDPDRGAAMGYGNSRLRETQYDTRSDFEHETLSAATFQYAGTLIELFREKDLEELKGFVEYFWTYVAIYGVADTLIALGELDPQDDSERALGLILDRIRDYGLAENRQVLDVSLEEIGNAQALIIRMQDTGWAHLSEHIAIVCYDSWSMLIFQLARDISGGKYTLYVNDGYGQGELGTVENTREAFLAAIGEFFAEGNGEDTEEDTGEGDTE